MSFSIFNQFSCIVLKSLDFRIAEEEFIAFNSPVFRFGGITNRCKSWNWFVISSLKCWDECSMSSHTEACNWNVLSTYREIQRNKIRKLFVDVWEHSEIFLSNLWSSINVITCWLSKLPIFIDVRNASFSRTCVRENTSYSVFSCISSKTRFKWKVLVIAAQSRKAIKARERFSSRIFYLIFRNIDSKGHLSLQFFTPVTYCL